MPGSVCRPEPRYRCVARKLAEMKVRLMWGRNIVSGFQSEVDHLHEGHYKEDTYGWKCSTLIPG